MHFSGSPSRTFQGVFVLEGKLWSSVAHVSWPFCARVLTPTNPIHDSVSYAGEGGGGDPDSRGEGSPEGGPAGMHGGAGGENIIYNQNVMRVGQHMSYMG